MNSKETKRKTAPLLEYAAEATTACLATMLQGNFLAIGISHLIIASQTGIVAGISTWLILLYAKTDKRWAISMVLGVATAIVDFFVHPGMFGPVALEATITGIGAVALSYLVGPLIHRARKQS